MTVPPPLKIVLEDHTGEERRVLRRERRRVRELHRAHRDRRGTTSTLLLRDAVGLGGYVTRTIGPVARLLARLLAPYLDGRLASGTAPESGPLVAARAEWLASGPGRWAVARDWRDLLVQASRPAPLRNPRVPLCRERIIGAGDELRAMVAALSVPLPVPARGVAMASRLLSDGAGPLYNPGCATDLPIALREMVERLDPATPLIDRA
jgi:hypothetical protein